MRVASDNQRTNGGWLHRLRSGGRTFPRSPRRSASTDSADEPAKASNVDTGSRPPASFATAEDAVADYAASLGTPDHRWEYRDLAGEVVLVVLRWTARGERKKAIRPVCRGAAGWTHGQLLASRPLYRLPELLAGDGEVYAMEGEPAADALVSLGLVATTASGRSKAAAKSDWSALAGRRVVVLLDNDKPGRDYRDDVLVALGALTPAPTVRIVELPGLPDTGDAVDWLAGGGSARDLAALVQAAATVALPTPTRPLIYQSFPTRLLPGAMRRLVDEGAAAIGCDASMVALPALAAAAGPIGATRVVRLKRAWTNPRCCGAWWSAPAAPPRAKAASWCSLPSCGNNAKRSRPTRRRWRAISC